jgi:transposase
LHYKIRSQIILNAAKGWSTNTIEENMGIYRKTVKRWRDRFSKARGALNRIDMDSPHKLRSSIEKILSDEQRPGGPPKFTDEQVAAIIAISCESPEKFELPISHWTPEMLRFQAIELKIVESISIRQIGRFLKERDLKPHSIHCWLNPNIENMEQFKEAVSHICEIYLSAEALSEEGVHVFSTDEKMGIQAREHKNPKQNMEPGQPERVDPEYIRHGTTGLIASRDVVTGEIVMPMVQPTRTEDDFAAHISSVISTHPNDKFIFVEDNLNTHMSESLVKLVAKICDIDESTLGVKEKSGILKSMASRAEFLMDNKHQIVFVYTPKHCSWLNQIECWFSILTRRLLNRRSSFKTIEELEQKIMSFIDFYNKFLKKPFQWNFKGKLLRA